MSLIELLVGMAISLIVLLIAYSFFTSSTGAAQAITNRAMSANNARLAVDSLEANLRFADYVNISGSGSTAILTVRNEASTATSNQPLCAAWTLTAQPANPAVNLPPTSWGLVEKTSTTSPVGTPGTTPVIVAGVTVPTGFTTAFSMPLPTLVEIDLAVNDESPRTLNAADSVTVHDVISPDNLHTSLANSGTC